MRQGKNTPIYTRVRVTHPIARPSLIYPRAIPPRNKTLSHPLHYAPPLYSPATKEINLTYALYTRARLLFPLRGTFLRPPYTHTHVRTLTQGACNFRPAHSLSLSLSLGPFLFPVTFRLLSLSPRSSKSRRSLRGLYIHP